MKKKINIDKMTCEHCVHHVEEALKELPGVVSARADLSGGFAEIESTEDIEEMQIRNAIEQMGYEVTLIQ